MLGSLDDVFACCADELGLNPVLSYNRVTLRNSKQKNVQMSFDHFLSKNRPTQKNSRLQKMFQRRTKREKIFGAN